MSLVFSGPRKLSLFTCSLFFPLYLYFLCASSVHLLSCFNVALPRLCALPPLWSALSCGRPTRVSYSLPCREYIFVSVSWSPNSLIMQDENGNTIICPCTHEMSCHVWETIYPPRGGTANRLCDRFKTGLEDAGVSIYMSGAIS